MNSNAKLDVVASNVIGNCMHIETHDHIHNGIVDSSATAHNCCFKELYNSYPSTILLPNSTKVKVEDTGSIKISEDIFLRNVFYNPTFRFNLLSLNSFRFIIKPNSFLLLDMKTLRTIGIC